MAGIIPIGAWLRGIGTASWLIMRAGRGIGLDLLERDVSARRRMADATIFYLWAPLPVLAMLASLVGVVAGIVAARVLSLYHVELVVEPMLTTSLCRDMIPILVGLFAVGRVSVELSARLASAGLASEVDALELLGHDAVRHFLSPALAGTLLAVPPHVLIAAASAVVSAGAVIDLSGETNWIRYLTPIGSATARALVTGMGKALLFVVIAFAVGATVGAGGARSPADVGVRATRAFTIGLLAIFSAAALWAVLA